MLRQDTKIGQGILQGRESSLLKNIIFLYLILSIFASICMYIYVPVKYNFQFNLIGSIIFLTNVVLFLKIQIEKFGLLNFHLFFLIAYFFMNIIYIVYIYPIDPEYFFIFQFGFNDNVLNKSLIISVIGALFYIFSVYVFSTKKVDKDFSGIPVSKTKLQLILIITTICFVLFVLVRGISSFFMSYKESVESIQEGVEGGLLSPIVSLFQVMFFILITYNFITIKNNYKNAFQVLFDNKVTILLTLIILFLYLVSGSRSLVVKILLTLGCLFSIYFKRLSGFIFIVGLVLGIFTLGVMSRTRATDNKMDALSSVVENSSPIDFAMDLIIVNRNVFLAVDEVERHGYSYGLRSSKAFFSFFPYFPVVAANLGLSQSDIESESFFQEETNIPYSPGSTLIGDLYMSFGIYSVISGMFLLGWFVSFAEKRSNHNIYFLYLYITLLGVSLLYPRFGFFFLSRFIVWGCVMIYFIQSIKFTIKQFEK